MPANQYWLYERSAATYTRRPPEIPDLIVTPTQYIDMNAVVNVQECYYVYGVDSNNFDFSNSSNIDCATLGGPVVTNNRLMAYRQSYNLNQFNNAADYSLFASVVQNSPYTDYIFTHPPITNNGTMYQGVVSQAEINNNLIKLRQIVAACANVGKDIHVWFKYEMGDMQLGPDWVVPGQWVNINDNIDRVHTAISAEYQASGGRVHVIQDTESYFTSGGPYNPAFEWYSVVNRWGVANGPAYEAAAVARGQAWGAIWNNQAPFDVFWSQPIAKGFPDIQSNLVAGQNSANQNYENQFPGSVHLLAYLAAGVLDVANFTKIIDGFQYYTLRAGDFQAALAHERDLYNTRTGLLQPITDNQNQIVLAPALYTSLNYPFAPNPTHEQPHTPAEMANSWVDARLHLEPGGFCWVYDEIYLAYVNTTGNLYDSDNVYSIALNAVA